MSALLLSCLTLCTLTSSQNPSKGTPQTMVITTDASVPGNVNDDLTAILYWESNSTGTVTRSSYNCLITPQVAQTVYTCGTTIPWTTGAASNTLLPFYVSLQYDTPKEGDAIGIDKIVVTLDNGFVYTMDTFCIHSNMACTFGLTSTGTCLQWGSKAEYDTVKVGGDTEFTKLYVDFRSDITGNILFADLVHEASIRPPNLVQLGITTGSNHDIDTVSAQWDNVVYKCSSGIPAADPDNDFTCSIDNELLCPGVNSSFWISIHNPDTGTGQTVAVETVRAIDETGKSYTMSQFCQTENIPFGITGSACTVYSSKVQRADVGIGWFLPKLVAWVAPTYPAQQCIFNYPNVADPAVEIDIIDVANIDGWDVNEYGGISTFQCPETPGPTKYPTFDPTLAPSLAPSLSPTQPPSLAPSLAPSIAPTQPPSLAPSLNPSIAPTQPPSKAPSIAPTQPPSLAPTQPPSLAPTQPPSLAPTQPPSNAPSIAPTQPPSLAPTQPPSSAPTQPPSLAPTGAPSTGTPSKSPTKYPTKSPTKSPTDFPTKAVKATTVAPKLVTKTNTFWAIIALVIFLSICFLCVAFIWWRRNKEDEEDENKATPIVAAAALATYHKKEDTYNGYDAGVINTAPSMLGENDDHYGGQYEAKESIELQEVKEEEIDGDAAGIVTGGKGDDAVLDMLADGHETGGGAVKKTDSQLNPQETFAEFTV